MHRRNFLLNLSFITPLAASWPAAGFASQFGSLSDSKIIAGLKEALEIGTGNAINLTGKVDGFFQKRRHQNSHAQQTAHS
jgi:hypothetical protein